ncbi:putative hemolysin-type calcium-binding region protein [Lyngbya aestuarii BL J]|uniref:Putative hemolysin-type calcium-binding region protein n=1 Tax=Lyngbya aestuarii BL J TaxID=1348334 RepID=U7QM54_9CYAN|nr:hypothetical protein [Lyngbya aestuarii]ERT08943.1 putative hemolysin-type calcium-binding region protein [Lyngbya aestuarii BL J]
MNFDIFDEDYYLKKYPYLQPAIEQGIIQSGLDHFQRFGLQQGLTGVSRYYDEAYYLAKNPDVAAAVDAGIFPSGLAHFIEIGYEQEGRTTISSDYNDFVYRETNLDLIPFIQTYPFQNPRPFRNGLEHFLKFGAEEGRYSNSFFEAEYLARYPNIIPAIESGVLRTGRDHYEQFGQFEEGRKATFIGTSNSDTLESFGVGEVELIGITPGLDAEGDRIYVNTGNRGQDILTGSSASDTFVLGTETSFLINWDNSVREVPPKDFYYNHFNSGGIAIIRNYDPNNDFIKLGHNSPDYYEFSSLPYLNQTTPDSLSITSNNGRSLAIVVGITDVNNLNLIYGNKATVERNFFEDNYLVENPDVDALVEAGEYRSGLDHYEQVGQFDGERSAKFIGTPGNDIVTAFGMGSHQIFGVDAVQSLYEFATPTGVSYTSDGSGEFDTLIGSSGTDTFVFGDILLTYNEGLQLQQFYREEGEALIQDFNQEHGDQIKFLTIFDETYSIFPSGDDLVLAIEGDTIGVLDGGADITLEPVNVQEDNLGWYKIITLG